MEVMNEILFYGSTTMCTEDYGNYFETVLYEGWNFNSGNYLFTTDTKSIHVSKFYCPSM